MSSATIRGLSVRLTRFRHDESGSATIESLLWLGMFFALLGLVTDASLAFFTRAETFRLVQDANRAFAVHKDGFDTTMKVEAFLRTALSQAAPNADITTWTESGMVITTVAIPLSDVTVFSNFESASLAVMGTHYVE